jgi:acyl carrier protein
MTIREHVFALIQQHIKDAAVVVTDETRLLGDSSLLDSMKLVQLSIALEEFAEEQHFTFDWTSDTAMSKSRSMFRTAGSLADAFCEQMENSR